MRFLKATPTSSGARDGRALRSGIVFRYGAMFPIAAAVTFGLTLSMAALIATEFTPQDKIGSVSFEINPRVEDIPDFKPKEKPDALKDVEVPPPPPTIGVIKTASVDLPFVEVPGKMIDFEMDKLVFNEDINVTIDKDPIPQVRIPPVFPNRFLQGNVSGYCRVRFDITAQGQPVNVETTLCTSSQLKSATIKSVQGWKYGPEIRNGRAVSRSGLETTIRFDLRDERGKILPLPVGF